MKNIIDVHEIPLYGVPLVVLRLPIRKSVAINKIKRWARRDGRVWLAGAFEDWFNDYSKNVYGCTGRLFSKSGGMALVLAIDEEVYESDRKYCEGEFDTVVGHEIQHIVQRICEHIEMPMCSETTEAMSYLHGYLHKYCRKILR